MPQTTATSCILLADPWKRCLSYKRLIKGVGKLAHPPSNKKHASLKPASFSLHDMKRQPVLQRKAYMLAQAALLEMDAAAVHAGNKASSYCCQP